MLEATQVMAHRARRGKLPSLLLSVRQPCTQLLRPYLHCLPILRSRLTKVLLACGSVGAKQQCPQAPWTHAETREPAVLVADRGHGERPRCAGALPALYSSLR